MAIHYTICLYNIHAHVQIYTCTCKIDCVVFQPQHFPASFFASPEFASKAALCTRSRWVKAVQRVPPGTFCIESHFAIHQRYKSNKRGILHQAACPKSWKKLMRLGSSHLNNIKYCNRSQIYASASILVDLSIAHPMSTGRLQRISSWTQCMPSAVE